MNADRQPHTLPSLDLAGWRKLPDLMICCGAALCIIGLVADISRHHNLRQFGYSWLLSFIFWLSLMLGALFLVMMHHLFDAAWSVPLRRYCEHLACLIFPWMIVFFIPISLLAPDIYTWMISNPRLDPALSVKWPLFTRLGFYLASAVCFTVWGVIATRLRYWSLRQDQEGSSQCTYRMRAYSAWGIVAYGFTLTLGAIIWMEALQYQWHSTLYGIYFFAGCAWVAVATAYVVALILDRQRLLNGTVGAEQYYFLGSMLLAFTVFSAYIHFSQYFVIWNANIPEETFWYVMRENGTWFAVGLILVFGHFLVPFLALLRMDVKQRYKFMVPLCVWIALMQYVDIAFNITPVLHPNGFPWRWLWLDVGCTTLMGGLLTKAFLRDLHRFPKLPLKDPRLTEALGLYLVPVPMPGQVAGEEGGPSPNNVDQLTQP